MTGEELSGNPDTIPEYWTACEYPERDLEGGAFHIGRDAPCSCRIAADARIQRLRAHGADAGEIRRAEGIRRLMDVDLRARA